MRRFRIGVVVLLALMASMDTMAQRRVVKNTPRPARVVHKVVVRRAHVRYAQLPRWGAIIRTVPPAAVVIPSGRSSYYFHEGTYYRPGNGGYTIVRPVRGLRIRVLPAGYRRIMVGPRSYYYYYGTFYRQRNNGYEYEVIDAPEHAVVDALPEGYEVVQKDGVEYYFLDGVYYAEVDAPEFEDGIGYEVIKSL